MLYTLHDIAKRIDHSPFAAHDDRRGVGAGYLRGTAVRRGQRMHLALLSARCSELLQGSDVLASTVIGFPHGSNTTYVKLTEAQRAIDDGGTEVDMVVNVGKVLSCDWRYVHDEIRAVVETTHGCGGKLKVIFENCYLQDEHKVRLCEICGELKADWVKTSTGFGTGGATVLDVLLMRDYSPPRTGEGGRGHSHSGYGIDLV